MKLRMIGILFTCLLLQNFAFAQGGAPAINGVGVREGLNASANGSFGARNAARCGSNNYQACINAALGYAQMGMSLMQMIQTMSSRDSLSPGTNWANPGIQPDLGPITATDRAFIDPALNAVRSGTYADYIRARDQMLARAQPDIDKLAANGVTFDTTAGTITTPSGTQNLEDLNTDASIDAMAQRLAKAVNLDTSGGGGMIAADSGSEGSKLATLSSSSSNVDSFLDKLNSGEVDTDKLVGLSKNLSDGSAIGVSMGNLFNTIHVKYKSLSTQNQFK